MSTTNLNDDYPVTCFSGATRLQSELAAAFDLVAPKPNWKTSINAVITMADGRADAAALSAKLISDAVVHFTGAAPTILIRRNRMHVTAPGYYATVGA